MSNDRWGWSFSPQDHRRGKGGFEGGYFTLKGITDVTFDTRDQAVATLGKNWHEINAGALTGACFQFKDQARYLVLFELIID